VLVGGGIGRDTGGNQTLKLAQAAEAVRCIEDGHPRGKVVVTP
jgi:hypothetical protein